MPDYGDYPVEGYIYNEPDGRPRPGVRYRDPLGDRRVLWALIGVFATLCVGIGGFAWMERSNTLTEWAFGDDRHECQAPGGTGSVVVLQLVFDVAEVRANRPEVFDSPGFSLDIEARTLKGDDVASVTQFFDTGGISWDSDGVLFDADFFDGQQVASTGPPVGFCDIELTPLDAAAMVGKDVRVLSPCNAGEYQGLPIPALIPDGPCD